MLLLCFVFRACLHKNLHELATEFEQETCASVLVLGQVAWASARDISANGLSGWLKGNGGASARPISHRQIPYTRPFLFDHNPRIDSRPLTVTQRSVTWKWSDRQWSIWSRIASNGKANIWDQIIAVGAVAAAADDGYAWRPVCVTVLKIEEK